ncbi:HIT family protein [Candidatus Beckwithbacteria bacterium CG22_combo_CG10-13_8_21_14_all_01_47_9]|uniref:HIT family protein n=4 Tax=Candidatus Beckwithiibacteriota TaxID=1752726 RepID=A0A2H0DZA9_9BACT|nr:MAG: HIT family protein [Candidatus Beckwithbacteria bacterium CG23_combo_of_CG06-09_8_20_14_all_47_9]PIP87513.1 MAG: HIT family protein [Candidatus Beckwithbacteria bacterium CG22_combo_CG10-13_8_21_14_all_01_47_9]PJA21852.1 MAG: HIT family protein [Candidatus Beckwithbacteria bacterium CG_4_10_14_0_2_um_filter_47_25]PJC66326.1 MAG: HIT family protein [Candidatus Beckwithbacteria bacterium CG_4_9_14_0_2_um_filter_47_11]
MPDCLFCKIIKGEIKSYKIYEDKEFLAFLDIFPKSAGHTLVIPKAHVQWVWDYPELGRYFELVGKLARHLRRVSGHEVVRGLVYGVEVPHAHVHLMPNQTDEFDGKQLVADKLLALAKRYRF